ncbi:hypothetical protein CICLE_v10003601mg [Citrus x clementina]|uniref:Uncharacterized protein n=1 Tax=Citrus clementina TaxID=85681 RepID=V4V0X3_CITCL|nr:hypothetical protein CICLE_v10003601mg [Citrus x clementina]
MTLVFAVVANGAVSSAQAYTTVCPPTTLGAGSDWLYWPTSIVSYVYPGKNAGEILTALKTFSSKEIYKVNVIGDAVSSNRIPRNVLKL